MCKLFANVYLYVSDTLPSVSLGGDLRCDDCDVLCLWCLPGQFAGSARTMERPTLTAAYWFFTVLCHPGTLDLLPCTNSTLYGFYYLPATHGVPHRTFYFMLELFPAGHFYTWLYLSPWWSTSTAIPAWRNSLTYLWPLAAGVMDCFYLNDLQLCFWGSDCVSWAPVWLPWWSASEPLAYTSVDFNYIMLGCVAFPQSPGLFLYMVI
jgi:hypothetical protein